MGNIIAQLNSLFRFFKRPHYTFPHHPISFADKIAHLIGLAIVMLIADIILIPFISVIDATSKIDIPIKFDSVKDWVKTIFIVAVAFPFFEELIFRYHLKSVKGGSFFYLAMITILLITLLVKLMPHKTAAIFIFILLCVVLIIIAVLLVKLDNQYRNQSTFIRYFPLNVWCTTFLFAMIHVFNNHYNTSLALLLSPLIVLPQLFGGMVLSYARLKYGVFSSMFIHGFHNLIVTVMVYLIS